LSGKPITQPFAFHLDFLTCHELSQVSISKVD